MGGLTLRNDALRHAITSDPPNERVGQPERRRYGSRNNDTFGSDGEWRWPRINSTIENPSHLQNPLGCYRSPVLGAVVQALTDDTSPQAHFPARGIADLTALADAKASAL